MFLPRPRGQGPQDVNDVDLFGSQRTGDPGGVREEGGKEARCRGRLGLNRGYFLRDQKLPAVPGNASNSNPKSLKFASEMPKIS